jgi:lysophospholipase L1-like esterase
MRSSRLLTIGILAATAVATAIGGTAMPARAASVNYVALGDSYASGLGAGNYIASSGSCSRSLNAYPALWAASHQASFSFAACSGATTSDVINSQLSTLSSSTTLVSVTIGGNDANFASTMETCVLSSTSTCVSAINADEQIVQNQLPGRLNTMLADIRAKAPSAKIVIVGYPRFYDLSVPICLGLSSTDHQAIDQGIDMLDTVLKNAASANSATFADARGAFSGHELCDGAGWLNSVTIPINSSYHPTATGQLDGYLPTFTASA